MFSHTGWSDFLSEVHTYCVRFVVGFRGKIRSPDGNSLSVMMDGCSSLHVSPTPGPEVLWTGKEVDRGAWSAIWFMSGKKLFFMSATTVRRLVAV
jgi:hypothetical protein